MLVQVQESLTINPTSDSGDSGSGSGNSKRLPTLDTAPESKSVIVPSPTTKAIKERKQIRLQQTEKTDLIEPATTEETNKASISVIQKVKNVTTHFIDVLQEALTRIINKLF